MTIQELTLYGLSKEDLELKESDQIAKEMIQITLKLFPEAQKIIENYSYTSFLELFIIIYCSLINQNIYFKPILDKILLSYNGNKREFILCNITNQLNSKIQSNCLGIGTNKIQKFENYLELVTDLGTIKVKNAQEEFSEEKYQTIWKCPLMRNCFNRCYDFIKLNPEFNVVLSYLPSYLYKGYYHAYLENKDSILDIARNAYFIKKEDGNQLLKGQKIAQLNYEEILKWEQFLKENLTNYQENNYPVLGILSWYLDYQLSQKENRIIPKNANSINKRSFPLLEKSIKV